MAGTNVLMKTTAGDITIELFTDTMPITAGNFLDLAEKGYYDGLHFHRVIQFTKKLIGVDRVTAVAFVSLASVLSSWQ